MNKLRGIASGRCWQRVSRVRQQVSIADAPGRIFLAVSSSKKAKPADPRIPLMLMAAAMAELGKKELKRARRAIFSFIDEASLCSLASIASSRGWTSTYAERWREIKLKVALIKL